MQTGDGPFPSGVMLHATAIAVGPVAAVIIGASGSGKSALALQIMALGGALVADDQTRLGLRDGMIVALAPTATRGLIEARGVGLLAADAAPPTPVGCVVDMDVVEKDRLPPLRDCRILGVRVPLIHRVDGAHFPAAILQYLRGGRSA